MKKINIVLLTFVALIIFVAASAQTVAAIGDGPYEGWKCSAVDNYTCTFSTTWPTPNGLYDDEAVCKTAPSCLPITTLTINPTTVNAGENVDVAWSATKGASVCYGTPDGASTYTLSTPGSSPWSWNTPGTHWVDMYCANANGNSPTVRKTVNVVQPPSATCSLSATPSSGILSPSKTSISGSLSWTANNSPTSCSIAAYCAGNYGTGVCGSSFASVIPPAGGSVAFSTQLPVTYTMTCSNVTGSGTCSAAVDVSGMPPTINMNAQPPSGTTGVFGNISYGVTSNDPRLNGSNYVCTKFSSPFTPGWGSGEAASLSGSGASASGSASYPALSQDTTFGITCKDPYGNFSGSGQTTVTVTIPPSPSHFACDINNNTCVSVAGSGSDSCDPRWNCGTGTLTLSPADSCAMADGSAPLAYSVFYVSPGGTVTLRKGAGADINSSNLAVIERTLETDEIASLTGHQVGTAQISGEFQGLVASTPVTVSNSCHVVNFSATPSVLGATPETVAITISGGKPNSSADLSRTALEYDNFVSGSGPARTLNQSSGDWRGTDASGYNNSTTLHSCGDDGSKDANGNPVSVKGYRIEKNTRVSFSGWGQSNDLEVTKDCRATVQINNPADAGWTLSGPTDANSASVPAVQGYTNLGSGKITYKVTDGTYVMTGLGVCTLSEPDSQTVIPGNAITYTINCPPGFNTHLQCLGSSCARVRGGGPNQNGCTANGQSCTGGTSHFACFNSSCAVVGGGGPNLDGCTAEDESCSGGGTHLECLSNSCAVVTGGGANQDGCVAAGGACSTGSQLTCSPALQIVPIGQNASFNVSGGSGGYTWTAAGGSPANGSGSSFVTTYASVGARTVDVVDGAGKTGSCSVDVSAPGPLRCTPASQSVSVGQSASLLASGGSGGYVWNAAGGSPSFSGGKNFNVVYSVAGDHSVSLSDGSSNVTCSVTVFPAGGSPVCSPASQTVGIGQTANFSVSGGNGGYNWTATGGTPNYGTGSSFSTSYSATGNRTVRIVDATGKRASCEVTIQASGVSHNECVNNACTSVAGGGPNRCNASADCGGGGGGGDPFHAACDPATNSCVNVAGAGDNLCQNDSFCGGAGIMHLECQSNACLIVGGPGENQCTTIGLGCVAPTSCTMSVNPKVISKGGSATLTWTCDTGVSGCVLYDATSGAKVSLGSVPSSCPTASSCGTVQKITPSKTGQYILECLKGGAKTSANVGVTVMSIIECNPIDPTCKQ